MNIGFFTDVYTPLVDGVVRSIILYRRELEKRGHRVYVFAPKKIKSKSDFISKVKLEDDERTFRFRAVDSVVIPGYPLAIPLSFKASKKIPQLALDLVHCQTPATMGLLGDIVALLENIPEVYTYHTYYPAYAKNYIFSGKFKTGEAVQKYDVFYCNRSDRVIVPSSKLKNILLDWRVKSRISVLPTGLDLQEFRQAVGERFKKKHHITREQKILLFVGRLGREKNIGFLIAVMKKISREREDVLLLIVGDGKDRRELERQAKKLGLKNHVLFTGFLPRAETIDAFAAADIFVFASRTDTQGLVLAEAAALGKPIVMVKDEGLGNIVMDGENGYVVAEDVDIFAKKILTLLTIDSLYAKMSDKSRVLAQSLSIERQTDKLLDIYQQAIREHHDTSWRLRFWSSLNKGVKVPVWVKDQKALAARLIRKSRKFFDFFR